jgi:hypothetical protein
MNPIISKSDNRMTATCPFCFDQVYETDRPENGEFACHIAFGLHVGNCKKRPDYVPSDMDRFMKKIFGD